MSSILSFDIISVILREAKSKGLLPDPKIFLCIPACTADAAAVNPNRIKTLLASGLITLDQDFYQEILLIVSSSIIKFLIA